MLKHLSVGIVCLVLREAVLMWLLRLSLVWLSGVHLS